MCVSLAKLMEDKICVKAAGARALEFIKKY